ncbi:MAG: T9SS type A sorting domain-containing protein [candidate division Zixibacteria bacterium]|nr:T9SS type A sorting domain-containing protein [candidate division Zixibacteria bacterium]
MLKRYVFVLAVLVVALLVPQQSMAEGQMWGNDVLVHQANHIYGFGMDQGDEDTLVLVVSDSSTTNLRDTLYIYRSTDNGQTWNKVITGISGSDDYRLGKADIVAAKGDSNFVFMFYIYHNTLWCDRHTYNLFVRDFAKGIPAAYENLVDFSVCQDIFPGYWLYVVYQTDQDSVIFKRSRDYGVTWKDRKNLTEDTPITSQPSVAWSQGPYLVVAGKTDDDNIYVIRNTNYGNSANWQDGQYPWTGSNCEHPTVAGSHALPDSETVFWVFFERLVTTPTDHYILNYHYSTDAGYTWNPLWALTDTSSGSRRYPSLHVLKENGASDITLAYRYEGTSPRQVRYVYKENAQDNPRFGTAPYTGVNNYDPVALPHQKAYTIKDTANSIISAVLYVDLNEGLYFDASSFTGVDDETGDEAIRGFSLRQNYPNPFNPTTNIEFVLSKSGQVKLEIFNILGEKIRTLVDQRLKAGHKLVDWDGKDGSGEEVASGVYFYRLQTENFTQTKKMVLIR